MKNKRHNYLIEIQYCGYRFHGWMIQPGFKTVQGMINKTINFVLGGEVKFKTLGTSRTDTYVSANHSAFELFVWQELDESEFFDLFNKNLPQDIKGLSIRKVDDKFNIIQDSKTKEYQYLFTFGEKIHPFCSPYMISIQHDLDIELMKEGAKLYEGTHYFGRFCKQPKEGVSLERTIDYCEIKENTEIQATFFPKKSYIFYVHGKGFMRHQVRMMIGTLFMLGKGELSLDDIREALLPNDNRTQLGYVAPASALNLHKITFDKDFDEV
ncbi:tRNA pseudouridine(38-40) synthase TruA [Flammeovirga sp. MY04]|uniref:tRNA pseudouridine synthase A n=1 Tax=Flammeovirga sp. MY04 TaxID=1191459 RepID=UPI00082453E4|nr:pseudouridine synthase [Flammeovirga sp. MY04]ANQ47960.2 tRNA pseudouridine(38-40) synthase TruA [Flammeovirga sp. MY04]